MEMKFILIGILSFGPSLIFAGPGEWNKVSIDNPTVLDLTTQAVEHHNQISSNDYSYKLVKIVGVSFQALNGIKYSITFIIGQTKCFKTDYNKNCALLHKNLSIMNLCSYLFWIKPGASKKADIIHYACDKGHEFRMQEYVSKDYIDDIYDNYEDDDDKDKDRDKDEDKDKDDEDDDYNDYYQA